MSDHKTGSKIIDLMEALKAAMKKPDRRWRVSFCCNHPDNGNFIGMVCGIHFNSNDGHFLELESPLNPCTFDVIGPGRDRVRVGRWIYRIVPRSYKTWEGNWCWDAADMSESEAKRLAGHRIAQGWQMDGGTDGCPLDPDTKAATNGA